MMIDKKIFSNLKKEIEHRDNLREEMIVSSRPVMKNAKQIIYALHRNELNSAKKMLDEAKSGFLSLKELVKKEPQLFSGSYSSAAQEYAEAACYYYYVAEQRLASPLEIGVEGDNYLLGICDLTGELARRAVFSVVNETPEDVVRIRKFVESIHRMFLEFEFRNSELRKKSDSIKWNLKKIEEILYELKLREKI